MENIKTKIKIAYKTYRKLYPNEYQGVREIVTQKKIDAHDKFASVGKGNGVLERAVIEYPETFFKMIVNVLTADELIQFRSKKDGTKLMLWMAREFPEFALAEKQ